MTQDEAEKFFLLNENWDQEELQEKLEAQLFEIKTFFLTKVPLKKMFQSRLNKLLKLKQALFVLTGKKQEENIDYRAELMEDDELLSVFKSYQSAKTKLKLLISNAEFPSELYYLGNYLIDLEKKYASSWYLKSLAETKIIVSKEADPMELLAAIKVFQNQGGITFEDLKSNKHNPPEILINEMKRLTLLFLKY